MPVNFPIHEEEDVAPRGRIHKGNRCTADATGADATGSYL